MPITILEGITILIDINRKNETQKTCTKLGQLSKWQRFNANPGLPESKTLGLSHYMIVCPLQAHNITGETHMYIPKRRQNIEVSKQLVSLNAMGPQWALIIFKQRSLREDFEEKKKKQSLKRTSECTFQPTNWQTEHSRIKEQHERQNIKRQDRVYSVTVCILYGGEG